jgi:glucose-1-phosphate thymidylyltransferase
MLAGIRNILLISTPEHLALFQTLLGDGSDFGIALSYAEQPRPEGLAQAFIIGESFIARDPCALILGDNIFVGGELTALLTEAASEPKGATIFAYRVEVPERYGVLAFDADGRVTDIVEKPEIAPSSWAVTGLYFYDDRVVDIAKSIRPSARGELEITDVNRTYLDWGDLHVQRLSRGYAWLDTGTHDSLLDASDFIRTLQHRQGLQIACLEEIAFQMGFIGIDALARRARQFSKTRYGRYLNVLLEETVAKA